MTPDILRNSQHLGWSSASYARAPDGSRGQQSQITLYFSLPGYNFIKSIEIFVDNLE
jgi:hypothetical protein